MEHLQNQPEELEFKFRNKIIVFPAPDERLINYWASKKYAKRKGNTIDFSDHPRIEEILEFHVNPLIKILSRY